MKRNRDAAEVHRVGVWVVVVFLTVSKRYYRYYGVQKYRSRLRRRVSHFVSKQREKIPEIMRTNISPKFPAGVLIWNGLVVN